MDDLKQEQVTQTPQNIGTAQNVAQPQPDAKHAFCMALPVSGGRPTKLTGDNPHDFIPFLKDSTAAWLNFPVKDIKKMLRS